MTDQRQSYSYNDVVNMPTPYINKTEMVLPVNYTKYVSVLISLEALFIVLIVFLMISGIKTYKFMLKKDRVLLFHFLFLMMTLIGKHNH